MSEQRKIKLLEPAPLTAGGKTQPKDKEYTVSAQKARYLVQIGKAKYATEASK